MKAVSMKRALLAGFALMVLSSPVFGETQGTHSPTASPGTRPEDSAAKASAKLFQLFSACTAGRPGASSPAAPSSSPAFSADSAVVAAPVPSYFK